MRLSRLPPAGAHCLVFLLAGALFVAGPHSAAAQAAPVCEPSVLDSPYIPVDSWIYPAVMRLYSLGYIDSAYIGMRPWTRSRVGEMLEEMGARIEDAGQSPVNDQAEAIYESLEEEIHGDMSGPCGAYRSHVRIESVYSTTRILSGTPLRDGFHLGQTVINDYGRPYENGANNYSGAGGYATAGRFALYVRGEFQAAPSAAGYSTALAQLLSTDDEIPFLNPATNQPYNQTTIPLGPLAAVTTGRIVEAYVSTRVLNHEISFGKQDAWIGPGLGGAMAWSNNAENIYSFRINRAEPLRIPLLSRLTGPFRYDFLIGSLKGHTYPNAPWVHMEAISFKPTPNLEIGFERTVIWGGKGHEPVNLHTFLKSFFSFQNVPASEKFSANDPGARFSSVDFAYRLPFLRNWATLYADGEVHDDISAIDAPRRAAWRPGIYLAHLPGAPSLDLRLEAVTSDPPVSTSYKGLFMDWETVQRQGYTNKGNLLGDWIGREAKGGQAWLTWHLSGNEWIQVNYRNQKAAKDFIPGGTTLNDFGLNVSKRLGRNFEVDGSFTLEKWKAPIYLPGQQTVTNTMIQLKWLPRGKLSF
ncbi:MAG TPA: capsule assembly Wzi family protein [Terracidiphilus sp.]|nr:capsule assembly Wzi family protein [Terracidiphilus sp.]